MSSVDWLPRGREAQLKMARTWNVQIKAKGKRDWKMDDEEVAAFDEAVGSAEVENNRPQNQRTKSTNINLKNAFNNLSTLMRSNKRRYFHVPPLTEGELVSLGLKMKDTIPTDIGSPKIQPSAKINYKASCLLELSISPAKEITGDKRAYHGCKIIYEVFSPTDTVPTDRKQLHESRFTRRKKEEFVFNVEDSGKRMYFSMRYENGKGAAGPWSPIVSAVIP